MEIILKEKELEHMGFLDEPGRPLPTRDEYFWCSKCATKRKFKSTFNRGYRCVVCDKRA